MTTFPDALQNHGKFNARFNPTVKRGCTCDRCFSIIYIHIYRRSQEAHKNIKGIKSFQSSYIKANVDPGVAMVKFLAVFVFVVVRLEKCGGSLTQRRTSCSLYLRKAELICVCVLCVWCE